MSLTTKDSHFIFDGTLYKQIDGVAMGSLLGPQHLKRFQSYLNYRHAKISLTIENEKRNRMSFFDVNVICEQANLQPLSTANQLLAEIVLILTVSYHPPTKLT